jgi:hypothetical protein
MADTKRQAHSKIVESILKPKNPLNPLPAAVGS